MGPGTGRELRRIRPRRADTVGKGHGRIEIRRCRATGDLDLLAHVVPDREWRDLTSLVWVESERHCGDRVSTEVRCFIPAYPPGPSRIRTSHAVHNMAILKRIANKRLAAAWNRDYLCQLVGLKPKPIWMQSSWPMCRWS